MNFKEFTDSVAGVLQRRLGEGHTVTVTEVLKNNDIRLTGIVIMEESDNVYPTIYLEESYRQYQDGASFQRIVEEILTLYEKQAHNIKLNMDFFRDFSKIEERIFHKLVNYDKNRELLLDVPHFRWHDLAVIFYYMMEDATVGRASILIHNNHLDLWGQAAEEVYRIAGQNMRRHMPELLLPMSELLEELMGVQVEERELSFYVLTNKDKMFGASAMLYTQQLKCLAYKLQSDLLILPSSVHEVLLLPDDHDREYDFYRQMVREVNATQVDPEEILSDSLYRYDREKAEIEEIFV